MKKFRSGRHGGEPSRARLVMAGLPRTLPVTAGPALIMPGLFSS